nr:lipocalin-like domain-containing protein [uncultured Carboxylicivirga sp.]
MSNENTSQLPVVGTWILSTIYYLFDDGSKQDMYGPNPLGVLMYDANGIMNAQLGSRNHKSYDFQSHSCAELFTNYMAYYGDYYEESPGQIIHEVTGCVHPQWVGEKEVRYYELKEEVLKIWTPKMKINGRDAIIEVYWKKA